MSRAHPYSEMVSFFYAKEGEMDQRAIAENKFDVIIEGDGSMRIVLELVKLVKGRRERIDWGYVY
mgnify:CR=1 FL=1